MSESKLWVPKRYEVFVKPTEYSMSTRKLEGLRKLAEIRAQYQKNPIKFIEDIIGAELLDAQAYALMQTWTTPYSLWVCSRGFGKSSVIDLMLMAKGMLFNNQWAYIASGSGDQAITTFKTLENIANKNIESMTGLSGVFKQEMEIRNASGDGFVHNPSGHFYSLYNGSFTKTLNSNIDRKRGARGNMVVFDECGFLSEEMMNVYGAFTIVNKDFKMGGDIDITTLPKEIPNQLVQISSASSIDTPFYSKYRDFSKKMLLGDPRYFVADINCDVVIRGTKRGKIYPASLLRQETVDAEMRVNQEKALREYYNVFTEDGGNGQIIKRALIARNSYVRPPVLYNDNNTRKFVIAYDPARTTDNSVVSIGELRYDQEEGWMMDIVNCVNFMDLSIRKKTPKTTPQQIKDLLQLILDYNGDADLYGNIECIMIDAGTGGGGKSIPDFLFEDWIDNNGNKQRGLIDKEFSKEYVRKFPNAVNKLKMLEPKRYKSEMFEALIKMVEGNWITFPEKYDNKGYLNILQIDSKVAAENERQIRAQLDKLDLPTNEYEARLAEELDKLDAAKTIVYHLSPDEEVALTQIDAMKEEIVNICRTKRESGSDMFKLPAHKDADTGASEATMHDDRAYTLAMLGWYLSEKRLSHIRNKKKPAPSTNLADRLPMRTGTRSSIFS